MLSQLLQLQQNCAIVSSPFSSFSRFQFLCFSISLLFSFSAFQFFRLSVSPLFSFSAYQFLCFPVSPLFSFSAFQFLRFSASPPISFSAFQFLRFLVSPLFSFSIFQFLRFAVSPLWTTNNELQWNNINEANAILRILRNMQLFSSLNYNVCNNHHLPKLGPLSFVKTKKRYRQTKEGGEIARKSQKIIFYKLKMAVVIFRHNCNFMKKR